MCLRATTLHFGSLHHAELAFSIFFLFFFFKILVSIKFLFYGLSVILLQKLMNIWLQDQRERRRKDMLRLSVHKGLK